MKILKSLNDWKKSGFKSVDENIFWKRFMTCKSCENWMGKDKIGYCKICNCTILKLKIPTEKCPINKWD